VRWFAAVRLREADGTRWEAASRSDVQDRIAWLMGRYSAAYASSQFRAPQHFFRWLAAGR